MEQKTVSKRKPRAKKEEVVDINAIIEKMKKKSRSSSLFVSKDIEGRTSYRLRVAGKPVTLQEEEYRQIMKAPGIEKIVRESGHSAAFDPPAVWYKHEYTFKVEEVEE